MAVQTSKRRTGAKAPILPRGYSTGINEPNPFKLSHAVGKGLPYSALESFLKFTGLPADTITRVLRIPPRTLQRRKTQGTLSQDESERLVRVAGIFERALDLFAGDIASAKHWLQTPRPALNGQTPLQTAMTEIGAREVEDLIGRLEHGVFS